MQGKFGDMKPALVLHPPQNLLDSCDKKKKKKRGHVRKPDLEQTEDSEKAKGISTHPLLFDSCNLEVLHQSHDTEEFTGSGN